MSWRSCKWHWRFCNFNEHNWICAVWQHCHCISHPFLCPKQLCNGLSSDHGSCNSWDCVVRRFRQQGCFSLISNFCPCMDYCDNVKLNYQFQQPGSQTVINVICCKFNHSLEAVVSARMTHLVIGFSMAQRYSWVLVSRLSKNTCKYDLWIHLQLMPWGFPQIWVSIFENTNTDGYL